MGRLRKNLATVIKAGFVPILVRDDFAPLFLCEIIKEAGVPVVEFTLRRDDLDKIPLVRKEFPDLILLIGSIVDKPTMVRFLKKRKKFYSVEDLSEFGVDGFVSILPFRKETYKKFAKKMILIPGVQTRGEAIEQLSTGAHLVKFVGVSEKELKSTEISAHSLVPVFYTGGATPEKIEGLIQSGVLVIGAGFDLILGERYQQVQKKPDKGYILDRLLLYKEKVREAREKEGLNFFYEIKESKKLLEATGRFLNV